MLQKSKKFFAYAKGRKGEVQIRDERSDALKLVQQVHREIRQIQRDLDELEYLIYKKDERVKIKFFNKGEADDTKRSKK